MAATGIKKLKRSHLMHLLDSTFGGETPSWFLIGKNIEDMSMDLGPDTATVKNILDETDVNDNGYEPSLSVETYYANTEDAIYEKIKSIALDQLANRTRGHLKADCSFSLNPMPGRGLMRY